MYLNLEFIWSYFNENPIPYDLRKGTKVFLPPTKSLYLGLVSVRSEEVYYGTIFLYQLKIAKLLMNSKGN